MKPIIQEETQGTILTKDITNKHLVVAVIDNTPCVLAKGCYQDNIFLSFLSINDGIARGNGYNFSQVENTPQLMVEYALKAKTDKIAVFDEKNWKQALQWLIDNA